MKRLIKYASLAIFTFTYTSAMGQQKAITRKDLLKAAINQNISSVEIKEITLLPGQHTPNHLHPCPVIGYIQSGKVLFQVEGEESIILNEGDAFYEPKNKIILHFDNVSEQKSLKFVAVYLKEGNEDIIKLLK